MIPCEISKLVYKHSQGTLIAAMAKVKLSTAISSNLTRKWPEKTRVGVKKKPVIRPVYAH